ncbi:hypothetical protein B484DRAFT_447678 [Ochromonadaceae sp. CCMP2298]|nr:hypothetical protein B484DRAFT_447678 [Ochromonadaceae sp. CCMP2298]|mmetsp:Transcript_18792/g.41865  ORF Transcript_18792/g.41865 Transcript_18792/m.41865 type:complete len:143 (+) Transcript_18792:101-529(+)
MSKVGNLGVFALGLTLGSLLCFAGMKLLSPDRRFLSPNAFFLGVTVVFTSLEDKLLFVEEFAPLAEYVRTREFSTLSYELLQSDKDRLQIFILERYVDKAAYLEVHKSSSQFLAFRAKFQTMIDRGTKVEGQSYGESGIGFI